MAAEYRLTIKVRNNLLLRRIEATRGFVSLPKFCAKHGFGYTFIVGLISMKYSPLRGDGTWREGVERLASVLRADPADLFPERQVRGEILTTKVEREVGEAELIALSEPEALALVTDQTPEKLAQDRDVVDKVLAVLPPREAEMVRSYFGIGVPRRTCEEIGEQYGITRTRCDQMIRKATTRMRSALYRKHHLMSRDRYNELEADQYGESWPGRDA